MPMGVRLPGPVTFLRYVWDLRLYILAVMIIFAMFYVVGYAAATSLPQVSGSVVSNFKSEVSPLKELSPVALMLGIFVNNAVKCLLAIVLGLAFGIAPAVFILINGLMLGFVVGETLPHTSLLYILVGMVPHGVIEMPMVFISSAIGLKLGVLALKTLMGKKEGMSDKVKDAILVYIVWIFPLLFLAAFIETFVTGPLLYMVFGGQ